MFPSSRVQLGNSGHFDFPKGRHLVRWQDGRDFVSSTLDGSHAAQRLDVL